MQSHDEFYLMQEHYFRPKLNNVHLVVYVVNKTSKLKQNVTSDRRSFFTFEWSEVGQTEHVYCLTNLLKKLLYEAMYLLFPSYIYHFIAAYLYNIELSARPMSRLLQQNKLNCPNWFLDQNMIFILKEA